MIWWYYVTRTIRLRPLSKCLRSRPFWTAAGRLALSWWSMRLTLNSHRILMKFLPCLWSAVLIIWWFSVAYPNFMPHLVSASATVQPVTASFFRIFCWCRTHGVWTASALTLVRRCSRIRSISGKHGIWSSPSETKCALKSPKSMCWLCILLMRILYW